MRELALAVEMVKDSEGFRGDPYTDTRGFLTIGYGTKLPLSEKEAGVIAYMRLEDKVTHLESKVSFFDHLPVKIQNVLAEMAYQLGVAGIMKFTRMWRALEQHDFKSAADEMLDSKWFKQMHAADMLDGTDSVNRAERLAEIVREAA